MESKDQQKKTDLKANVFAAISEQRVEPTERWWFEIRAAVIWLLLSVALMLGAVTFAVLLYITKYQRYAMYEVTHQNLASFVFSALPYMWISLFVAAGALAFYEIRNTRRGYKYSAWKLGLVTLVGVLVVGFLFEGARLGSLVDTKLGENMSGYDSQSRREYSAWQQPETGRLIGTVSSSSALIDAAGNEWTIKTAELRPFETNLLQSGKEVRVVGTTTEAGEFVVCGVFPTMRPDQLPIDDMKQAREEFLNKKREYKKQNQEKMENRRESPCTQLPAMKR